MIYHEQTVALSNQNRTVQTQRKQNKEEVSCAYAEFVKKTSVIGPFWLVQIWPETLKLYVYANHIAKSNRYKLINANNFNTMVLSKPRFYHQSEIKTFYAPAHVQPILSQFHNK